MQHTYNTYVTMYDWTLVHMGTVNVQKFFPDEVHLREVPEFKQPLNALSPRGPLPNLSSDQLPKDTHEVSGLSGSVWCTPSLVVWDLVRPKRFASVSRPFRPKPTPEDPRAGPLRSFQWVYGAIATYA
jgi:hypothetical protein